MLVEAVTGLVHRPEEPVEAVVEVPRRDADVLAARAARERMDRRVESPVRVVEAEPPDHLELECLLALEREIGSPGASGAARRRRRP